VENESRKHEWTKTRKENSEKTRLICLLVFFVFSSVRVFVMEFVLNLMLGEDDGRAVAAEAEPFFPDG
jgi:ABC-type phosphate/phosphonate transport system permease subunit